MDFAVFPFSLQETEGAKHTIERAEIVRGNEEIDIIGRSLTEAVQGLTVERTIGEHTTLQKGKPNAGAHQFIGKISDPLRHDPVPAHLLPLQSLQDLVHLPGKQRLRLPRCMVKGYAHAVEQQ